MAHRHTHTHMCSWYIFAKRFPIENLFSFFAVLSWRRWCGYCSCCFNVSFLLLRIHQLHSFFIHFNAIHYTISGFEHCSWFLCCLLQTKCVRHLKIFSLQASKFKTEVVGNSKLLSFCEDAFESCVLDINLFWHYSSLYDYTLCLHSHERSHVCLYSSI